jgi:hypothetical protein
VLLTHFFRVLLILFTAQTPSVGDTPPGGMVAADKRFETEADFYAYLVVNEALSRSPTQEQIANIRMNSELKIYPSPSQSQIRVLRVIYRYPSGFWQRGGTGNGTFVLFSIEDEVYRVHGDMLGSHYEVGYKDAFAVSFTGFWDTGPSDVVSDVYQWDGTSYARVD